MTDIKTTQSELAIIGTGMAGMAAAIFAAKRGIETVQIGVSSSTIYATGYLDLMGVHPMDQKKTWNNPWHAIDALANDIPDHPYARMRQEDIRSAFGEFLNFMKAAGLPYKGHAEKNTNVLSPMGTVKPTYCVPHTMWAGAMALAEKHPCLILDFWGLKGFSAVQIVEMLLPGWPDLRAARIAFPVVGPSVDLYTEQMGRSLEIEKNRVKLAEEIKPHLNDAKAVGMPAILGIYNTGKVMSHLKDLLGTDVFEIPTIPPSLPGIRMKEAFETQITQKGVRLFSQKRVLNVRRETDGRFILDIGDRATGKTDHIIKSNGIILAGGRFLGMGLHADRKKIKETVFDLPVAQPDDRSKWHQKDFFDPHGHQINQAGIEIDAYFRPLDDSGQPAFENLFAAGSILAHQDWMRQKCGAGLAIATSYAAVKAFGKNIKK